MNINLNLTHTCPKIYFGEKIIFQRVEGWPRQQFSLGSHQRISCFWPGVRWICNLEADRTDMNINLNVRHTCPKINFRENKFCLRCLLTQTSSSGKALRSIQNSSYDCTLISCFWHGVRWICNFEADCTDTNINLSLTHTCQKIDLGEKILSQRVEGWHQTTFFIKESPTNFMFLTWCAVDL